MSDLDDAALYCRCNNRRGHDRSSRNGRKDMVLLVTVFFVCVFCVCVCIFLLPKTYRVNGKGLWNCDFLTRRELLESRQSILRLASRTFPIPPVPTLTIGTHTFVLVCRCRVSLDSQLETIFSERQGIASDRTTTTTTTSSNHTQNKVETDPHEE